MKNSPTVAEDRPPEPSPAWRDALVLFDADLRRRGAAEKTRRAYAIDLGQFAAWCDGQGLDPAEVTPRTLRRYAATLSDRRAVAATVARKLAALRAFYRALREHGQVAQNPADLIPAPKRPRNLPRVLRPDEMAAVLDRIPASTPLELRDRALFGARHAGGRLGRLRRRGAARRGQGVEDPHRARRRAGAARRGALPRARAAGAPGR
jgi:site-specific recombinase XerC